MLSQLPRIVGLLENEAAAVRVIRLFELVGSQPGRDLFQNPVHTRANARTNFTFPNTNDLETIGHQSRSSGPIPLFVPLYLFQPVAPICLWNVSAAWATMPETSIHKNSNFLAAPEEIWHASHVLRVQTPASNTTSQDGSSQPHLR